MSFPVTPERVAIAIEFGLDNVPTAAVACREADLPYWAACALLEKESGGRNVYGHDAGGALSGFEKPVNKGNFEVFRWLVLDEGQTSNGVGPCQITWKGFFPDMEAKGLKAWDVHDNMLYGFQLLAGHFANEGTWEGAGTRYNGAASYGRDFVAKANQWRDRLDIEGRPVA